VPVTGEGRPFLAALAVPGRDAYRAMAGDRACRRTREAASTDPRLEPIVREHINQRLTGFPGYAKIRRVAIAPRPWSLEYDLMTPTMNLKRERILEPYAAEFARLCRVRA
jgi:long-chain acyl-CoA synthetase